MHLGFSNTLTSFKRYVNKIVVEKLDIFIIICLDNIIIYNENLSQIHINVIS